ncbi:TIGR03503 family protein [Pseudoalteromonas fuliginea]|uniref:TIGR03503 family protein n=1 Tax=Pseudoalteromonas fuliginea TaxID=1872678 RepID=A0ABQ6RM69_9GAMM|nr:TIGR03503 family protein [Pseudoalteromonas fuliginea]KAA1164315.1 TIGR03503 family protein [Pseudoalteromonas fuliginea]KAA1169050.1 TIGR03503 family protein [Pseudoalteromonas fuliginea]
MKTMCFVTVLIAVSCFTNNAYSAKQVEVLKRDGQQNEIPLLENRFRIDSQVDEITLLFFRKAGTPAVILVRPDGSKYFAPDSVKDPNIEWFDELNYDLVTIKKPTPGPWQVIGSILPDSRIVVLGEVSLQAESLPSVLFRGESVKVTGRVLNDGEPINANLFKDVVSLHVDFVSTNNESFANFGAGIQEVAEFKDDGRGFDERPKDGVFTGEFELDFPAGEWTPELYIATPLLQRRITQKALIIHEPPFEFDIALAKEDFDDHILAITIDANIVKPETVIIQGKIYYPNNEEQMFTIDAMANVSRQLTIKNYDWGRYSVELSVFGTNINDREFMATLPTYKFEIERPIEAVPEIDPATIITPDEMIKSDPDEGKMTTSTIISLIVGCNIFILLVGWLLIRIFVQKKSIKFNVRLPFLKKKKASEDDVTDSEKNQVGKNGSKSDKSGEILNLSMTDD